MTPRRCMRFSPTVFDDGADGPFETWWARLQGDPEFDPALCFLVFGSDDVLAAAALCWTTGFIKDLAVRPEARRRGLGRALDAACLRRVPTARRDALRPEDQSGFQRRGGGAVQAAGHGRGRLGGMSTTPLAANRGACDTCIGTTGPDGPHRGSFHVPPYRRRRTALPRRPCRARRRRLVALSQ